MKTKTLATLSLLLIASNVFALECSDDSLDTMESKLGKIENTFDKFDKNSKSQHSSALAVLEVLNAGNDGEALCSSLRTWNSKKKATDKSHLAFSEEIQSFEKDYYSRSSSRAYTRRSNDTEDSETVITSAISKCNGSSPSFSESEARALGSYFSDEVMSTREDQIDSGNKSIDKKVSDYNKFGKLCKKLAKQEQERAVASTVPQGGVAGGVCMNGVCQNTNGYGSSSSDLLAQIAMMNQMGQQWGASPMMQNPYYMSNMGRMYNPYQYMMPTSPFMSPNPYGFSTVK